MSMSYLSGFAVGALGSAATCLGVKSLSREVIHKLGDKPFFVKYCVTIPGTAVITDIFAAIIDSKEATEFTLGISAGYSLTKPFALYIAGEELAIDEIKSQNGARKIIKDSGFDKLTTLHTNRQWGLIAAITANKFATFSTALQQTICAFSAITAVKQTYKQQAAQN